MWNLYPMASPLVAPAPDPDAVLGKSSIEVEEAVPTPEAVADLIVTTSLTAVPDPTPEPDAVLRFFTSLLALDAPAPVPLAGRSSSLLNTDDEVPDPDPEACLITNRNGSASPDEVPDPVADLKSISRSVLVDAPAEPDPVADLMTMCNETVDWDPVPLVDAVLR